MLWLGVSPKSLLVANARNQFTAAEPGQPIEWDRIADIRAGFVHTTSTIGVHVWREIDCPDAGTKIGLHIASLGLPMRTKTLVAEVLTYRPGGHGDEGTS